MQREQQQENKPYGRAEICQWSRRIWFPKLPHSHWHPIVKQPDPSRYGTLRYVILHSFPCAKQPNPENKHNESDYAKEIHKHFRTHTYIVSDYWSPTTTIPFQR